MSGRKSRSDNKKISQSSRSLSNDSRKGNNRKLFETIKESKMVHEISGGRKFDPRTGKFVSQNENVGIMNSLTVSGHFISM